MDMTSLDFLRTGILELYLKWSKTLSKRIYLNAKIVDTTSPICLRAGGEGLHVALQSGRGHACGVIVYAVYCNQIPAAYCFLNTNIMEEFSYPFKRW